MFTILALFLSAAVISFLGTRLIILNRLNHDIVSFCFGIVFIAFAFDTSLIALGMILHHYYVYFLAASNIFYAIANGYLFVSVISFYINLDVNAISFIVLANVLLFLIEDILLFIYPVVPEVYRSLHIISYTNNFFTPPFLFHVIASAVIYLTLIILYSMVTYKVRANYLAKRKALFVALGLVSGSLTVITSEAFPHNVIISIIGSFGYLIGFSVALIGLTPSLKSDNTK